MKKRVVICDIDNTLLDCQSAIKKIYPSYNLLNQVSYSYDKAIKNVSAQEILSLYNDSSFYSHVKVNESVIKIIQCALKAGDLVVFISLSTSDFIHKYKQDLLFSLGLGMCPLYRDGVDFNVFGVENNDVFANDLNSLIDVYNNNNFEIMVIDDSPFRLSVCLKKNIPVCIVEHPYNYKRFARHKNVVFLLKPNYATKMNRLKAFFVRNGLWL